MDKYLSANELLERWNRRDFQLFDLCKEGKLQAYDKYGKRIVDLNSCEKTKKLSYDEILFAIRMQEGPKPEGNSLRRRITEELKRKRAREIYDAQLLDTPIIPEGCVGFDYRLSNNATIAEQKMTEFMRFFFKERDIKSYEIDHDLYYPDKEIAKIKKQDIASDDIQDDTTEQDPDEFIRDLTVYYENDSEIKIKRPGKEIKSCPYHIIGFRSNRTKEFKTLIKILQNHPHIYHGKYSKDRKLLNEIDKKLKMFFVKEFAIEMPSKVKTYGSSPN